MNATPTFFRYTSVDSATGVTILDAEQGAALKWGVYIFNEDITNAGKLNDQGQVSRYWILPARAFSISAPQLIRGQGSLVCKAGAATLSAISGWYI